MIFKGLNVSRKSVQSGGGRNALLLDFCQKAMFDIPGTQRHKLLVQRRKTPHTFADLWDTV